MQPVTDLGARQLTQIPFNILQQMGHLRPLHLSQSGWRPVIQIRTVPIVRVVAVVGPQYVLQVVVEAVALYDLPDLPLQQRQLSRIQLLRRVILVRKLRQLRQRP